MNRDDKDEIVNILENAKAAIDDGDPEEAHGIIDDAIAKLGGDKPYVPSAETTALINGQRAWKAGWSDARGGISGWKKFETPEETKAYGNGRQGWWLSSAQPSNPAVLKTCTHPEMYIDSSADLQIPRLPLRHGSAEVHICSYCNSWRMTRHVSDKWTPGPYATVYDQDVADQEEY